MNGFFILKIYSTVLFFFHWTLDYTILPVIIPTRITTLDFMDFSLRFSHMFLCFPIKSIIVSTCHSDIDYVSILSQVFINDLWWFSQIFHDHPMLSPFVLPPSCLAPSRFFDASRSRVQASKARSASTAVRRCGSSGVVKHGWVVKIPGMTIPKIRKLQQ